MTLSESLDRCDFHLKKGMKPENRWRTQLFTDKASALEY